MHLSFTDSRKYVFNMITPCKIQVSDLSHGCKVRMNHNLYSLITLLPGMHESQLVCIHHTASTLPSPFYMRDHSTSLASISVSLIPLRRIHPTCATLFLPWIFRTARPDCWGSVKTGSSRSGTDERGKCDNVGLSAACPSNEATIRSVVVAVA